MPYMLLDPHYYNYNFYDFNISPLYCFPPCFIAELDHLQ